MGGLMEVKVFQTFDAQSCVNTFHYFGQGIPAVVSDSFALTAALGFIDGFEQPGQAFYSSWKAAVNVGVQFTEIQVKRVYEPEDFYVLPLSSSNTGGQSGEAMASFVSYGIQTNRVRADIRRGNKRFVGVSEGAVGNLGALTSTQLGLMAALCTEAGKTLTYDDEGNTLTYIPCVVSKEKYFVEGTRYAYRYYETESLQQPHLATGVVWQAKPLVTSQVSRKRGNGS